MKLPALPPSRPDTSLADPAIRPATADEALLLLAAEEANAKATSTTTSGDQPSVSGSESKKPRKPLKLDPKLLQRALQLKNQSR